MHRDPYIKDLIAAHRAGVSIAKLAQIYGMGDKTVRKIVKLNVARRGKLDTPVVPPMGPVRACDSNAQRMEAQYPVSRSSALPPHSTSYASGGGGQPDGTYRECDCLNIQWCASTVDRGPKPLVCTREGRAGTRRPRTWDFCVVAAAR